MKTLLTFALTVLTLISFAQDSFVDSLIRSRLLPEPQISVNYNSIDFKLERPERTDVDPITEEQLDRVLDSLAKYPSKEMDLRVGSIYQRMGKTSEANFYLMKALKDWKKEAALYPDSAEILESIFFIQFGLNDYVNALKTLEIQREIAPNDTNYYNTKFYLQLFSGDMNGAIETAKYQLSLHPDWSTPYYNMTIARCYAKLQEHQLKELPMENMLIDLSHIDVIEGKTEDPQMMAVIVGSRMMAFFFKTMGVVMEEAPDDLSDFKFPATSEDVARFEEYKSTLSKLKRDRTFKNDYFIQYSFGVISFIKNDRETAIDHFDKAVNSVKYWNSSQDNPEGAYNNLICMYAMEDRIEELIAVIEKGIELRKSYNPSIEYHILLGRYKAYINDPTFDTAFQDALEMDSKCEEVMLYRAMRSLLDGDTKHAENLLDQLFTQNDNNEELYYALTLLSLKTEDNDTALFLAERILKFYPEDVFALAVQERLTVEK